MQRNMSYRKPVPEYIPSPPPSPLPPPLAKQALNSTRSEGEALDEKPTPPLPDNRGEILAEVTVIERVPLKPPLTTIQNVGVSTVPSEKERDTTALLLVSSEEPITSTFIDAGSQDQESITKIAGSQYLLPSRQRRKRGLPKDYRPPTPPLRSHSKQTPLSVRNTEDIGIVSDGNSSHGTYFPNTSTNHFNRSYTMQVKPSSSFRTDRTMVSTNTTNYSMGGWPIGLPASWGPIYSDPTLVRDKNRNVDTFKVPQPDSSNEPNAGDTGCFACWPNLSPSRWTKMFSALL